MSRGAIGLSIRKNTQARHPPCGCQHAQCSGAVRLQTTRRFMTGTTSKDSCRWRASKGVVGSCQNRRARVGANRSQRSRPSTSKLGESIYQGHLEKNRNSRQTRPFYCEHAFRANVTSRRRESPWIFPRSRRTNRRSGRSSNPAARTGPVREVPMSARSPSRAVATSRRDS
jgi:hypothetical protein